MLARRFQQFGRWSRARRSLALEAALALTKASILVGASPFRIAVKSSSGPLRPARDRASVKDVRWAIEVASRHLPWRIVCFQRGLAMQRMLRRRGLDARLHYGVGHDATGILSAHVWTSVGEQVVIGEDEVGLHRTVASFP